MGLGEKFFDIIYKLYTFNPRLRRVLTWATFSVGNMPQYHINLSRKDGAPIALLVEDQADVPRLASCLDTSEKLTEHREYLSYSGSLMGVRVLVISMGFASPPLAIGMEELFQVGVKTFLFAGACRALSPTCNVGEILLVEGAVRQDGTSHQYLPASFPAVPDTLLASCLLSACKKNGVKYRRGFSLTRDVDYFDSATEAPYLKPRAMSSEWDWENLGVCAVEYSAATLFGVSQVLKARAACLLEITEPRQPLSLELFKTLVEGARMALQKVGS